MKARYAFWGDGARYRANYSVISPTSDRAKNCQIAFDGRRFQELTESNRCLFIDKRQPTRSADLDPVNPALEPVVFLIPFWPYLDLGGHRLTLWHLQQPASKLMPVFWKRFQRGGRIIHGRDGKVSTLIVPAGVAGALSSFWQTIPRGEHLPRVRQSSLAALLFPQKAVGGAKGFSYTVKLSQRLGYMPLRIRVIDRFSKSVEVIEFHYRVFKVGRASVYIPSRVEKVVRGWGQLPSERVTIRLRHIVVGGSPPPNIFVIDFHLADIVVDGRAKKVLPVPGTTPP
ncbi:MAG: hypothetical protein HKL96_04645 [Phycisphaerales bacterium]|nr:hypothetical protein [Phycisphaerales bacterium]